MATIVTYDIPSKHGEFKALMLELGYKDQISGLNCKVIYFPNTTLYHPTRNADTARDEAKNIALRLGVNLERCVATKWENWAAICGASFK